MTKKQELITGIVISSLIVILFVPAFYMTEDKLFLGKWLIDIQMKFFGGYFPTSTFMIILFIEMMILFIFLGILAKSVYLITGKKLLVHLKN